MVNLGLLEGQDFLSDLKAINVWHVQVHKDDLILDSAATLSTVSDDFFYRLLTTECKITSYSLLLE